MNRDISIVKKGNEKYCLHLNDINDRYAQNMDITIIYLMRRYKFSTQYIIELTLKYHITFPDNIDKKNIQFIDIKNAYLYFYSKWEAQQFLDEIILPLDMVKKLINT